MGITCGLCGRERVGRVGKAASAYTHQRVWGGELVGRCSMMTRRGGMGEVGRLMRGMCVVVADSSCVAETNATL